MAAKATTPTPSEGFFTVESAAKLLHCSTETVRREIRRGNIAASRFGRRIVIHPDDLRRALKPIRTFKGPPPTTTIRPELHPDRIRRIEQERSASILALADSGNVDALAMALEFTGWSIGKRLRYARSFVNSDARERARLYAAIDAAATDTPFRRARTGDHTDTVPARAGVSDD